MFFISELLSEFNCIDKQLSWQLSFIDHEIDLLIFTWLKSFSLLHSLSIQQHHFALEFKMQKTQSWYFWCIVSRLFSFFSSHCLIWWFLSSAQASSFFWWNLWEHKDFPSLAHALTWNMKISCQRINSWWTWHIQIHHMQFLDQFNQCEFPGMRQWESDQTVFMKSVILFWLEHKTGIQWLMSHEVQHSSSLPLAYASSSDLGVPYEHVRELCHLWMQV